MGVEDRSAWDGAKGEVGMGWAWMSPACALRVCDCATLRLWYRVREYIVATGQNHKINHSQSADLRESNVEIGNP